MRVGAISLTIRIQGIYSLHQYDGLQDPGGIFKYEKEKSI